MNLAIKDIRHNLGRFALTTVGVGMLLIRADILVAISSAL
jgi:hypothetical protein